MKAVLDIGKTNVKLQLVDNRGRLCESYSRKNTVITKEPYPHADISGIWQWLMETLAAYAQVDDIRALVVTTHGATAALVDSKKTGDGLALPVLDYEYTGINRCDQDYRRLRSDYSSSLSPELPAGLNLGRQIFWLQQNFPSEFSTVTSILMYPQYWGWRLTGQLAGEVTSLGCHTDLWSPLNKSYSSLVTDCHWQGLMPPLKSAWEILGLVSPQISLQTGLSSDCEVYVGLHDSNASYLRYLLNKNAKTSEAFTVISTGTWTILMNANTNLSRLNAGRDMLANCDVYADPVACARFMGGREYDLICQRLGGDIQAPVFTDVQTAIDHQWLVTPDFSGGNGPFAGLAPIIDCPVPSVCPAAVATLYCALMIDQRLTDLQSTGAIYIEGAFLKNPLLCQLVAQLRSSHSGSSQTVYLSSDDTGTVQGAVLLTQLEQSQFSLELEVCIPSHFSGLEAYKNRWYGLINEGRATK